MMRAADLTGQVFGRLTAKYRAPSDRRGQARWVCRCTCQKTKIVAAKRLLNGETRSCGCWREELRRERKTIHGQYGSPAYRSWCAMLRRCHGRSDHHDPYYRAKGIKVCARWRTFKNFYADMGDRPDGHTLDRRDNNKGYTPTNCRWATRTQQRQNRSDSKT